MLRQSVQTIPERNLPVNAPITNTGINNPVGIGNVIHNAVKKKLTNNRAPICHVNCPKTFPGRNNVSMSDLCVRTAGKTFQKILVTSEFVIEMIVATAQNKRR